MVTATLFRREQPRCQVRDEARFHGFWRENTSASQMNDVYANEGHQWISWVIQFVPDGQAENWSPPPGCGRAEFGTEIEFAAEEESQLRRPRPTRNSNAGSTVRTHRALLRSVRLVLYLD